VRVVKEILGAHRDPRSHSDSMKLMIYDREVKQPFGEKRRFVSRVVSELNTKFTSVGRKINVKTMSPRRSVDLLVANRAMEREMRELCERLGAM
jgi:hypothetical protein